MNYLAHLYLSGNEPGRMIGNFIADHVKGKMITAFSENIREGILLHRRIDAFTDEHPVVAESKARLRTTYRKYAPVIVDVFYDHFLAKEWETYHHQPLEKFTADVYGLLQENSNLLPERTRLMLDYMQRQNWLLNYREVNGIRRALTGMSKRTTFISNMEHAADDLESGYDEFRKEFTVFFADLRSFTAVLNI